MLIRYKQTENGKRKKLANVYSFDDHGLRKSQIAREALAVTSRLQRAGFDAYIVGGAVRDLLLGRRPKDFDVVTSAPPRRIRRIFRNSRIIGKRFQLVHVFFGDTIIEVSTFRADTSIDSDGIFGTMAEDVQRRDFTMNALYYEPEKEHIIDYVGGFDDIKNRRVRALVPLAVSFPEDPVRMIRALRYAATTGFSLRGKLSRHIRRRAPLLQECPISRLTEELFKILGSGNSADFFESASYHGLLTYLLPNVAEQFGQKTNPLFSEELVASLRKLDREVLKKSEIKKGLMLSSLSRPFFGTSITAADGFNDRDPHLLRRDVFLRIKEIVSPLTPPNLEVDKAAGHILGKSAGKHHPKRRRRKRHPGRATEAKGR